MYRKENKILLLRNLGNGVKYKILEKAKNKKGDVFK